MANPSALHSPVTLAAARAGAHLLIEKPVAHELSGLRELEQAVGAHRLVPLVGFRFRFSPGLRELREWIPSGEIEPVVSAQAHWRVGAHHELTISAR